MQSNRRTQPIPQDFISALARTGVTPNELLDQIRLAPPPAITQPPIAPATYDDPPVLQLDGVFGDLLTSTNNRAKWMPAHLPDLPSRHTWKSTPVETKRETNARKIRELATEEGVLAEKAMRRLLANGGSANTKTPFTSKATKRAWEDTMKDFLHMDAEQADKEDNAEFEGFGVKEVEHDTAMLVNYERRYWIKSAQNT